MVELLDDERTFWYLDRVDVELVEVVGALVFCDPEKVADTLTGLVTVLEDFAKEMGIDLDERKRKIQPRSTQDA